MKINWIVILKVDDRVPEFYPCEENSEAERLYEHFKQNWSDVYLCKVEKGPLV
jgi:hypothetical protein